MYKNSRKEDLISVAKELGIDIPPNATIITLKKLIEETDAYKDDPEFISDLIHVTVTDRKTLEQSTAENLKLDKQLEIEKRRIDLADKKLRLISLEKELNLLLNNAPPNKDTLAIEIPNQTFSIEKNVPAALLEMCQVPPPSLTPNPSVENESSISYKTKHDLVNFVQPLQEPPAISTINPSTSFPEINTCQGQLPSSNHSTFSSKKAELNNSVLNHAHETELEDDVTHGPTTTSSTANLQSLHHHLTKQTSTNEIESTCFMFPIKEEPAVISNVTISISKACYAFFKSSSYTFFPIKIVESFFINTNDYIFRGHYANFHHLSISPN